MIVRIDQRFALPLADLLSLFGSPSGWVRLYGEAGAVRALEDGWHAVPMRGSPWPLVARVTAEPEAGLIRWELRGFWRGRGELAFRDEGELGVRITGFEEVALSWLGPLSPLVEPLLERRFRAIWESGWRRLRRWERVPSAAAASSTTGGAEVP